MDGEVSARNRAHFFALAARVMRQVLINHAEQKAAAKRGDGWDRITLEDAAVLRAESREVDLLALHDAMLQLSRLDPRQSQVVELRFFGGLTVEETAEVLNVSHRTVEMDWRMARLWLRKALGDGDPL